MLKEQAKRLTRSAQIADGLVLGASYLLANYFLEGNGEVDAVRNNAWILLVIVPVWYGVFSWIGMYKTLRTRRTHEILKMVLKRNAIGGIIVAAVIFLLEPIGYREFFLYFIAISTLLFLLQKTTFLLVMKFLKRNGFRKRHIVIVGKGEETDQRFRILIPEHRSQPFNKTTEHNLN